MFLYRIAEALETCKVDYAIAGGYAVALHGAVRGTVDVDLVLALSEKNFIAAETALIGIGLRPRLPVSALEVFRFREEYIRNRNLIAWTFYNPANPAEIVDLILTHDRKKMRVTKVKSGGRSLPVIAVTDLIQMKKMSGRPQDLEDIKALEGRGT